jgi:hypothetical protein
MSTSTTRNATRPATTVPESLPTRWSSADEQFFGIVAAVLATDVLWGASTLLASYDPEPGPA